MERKGFGEDSNHADYLMFLPPSMTHMVKVMEMILLLLFSDIPRISPSTDIHKLIQSSPTFCVAIIMIFYFSFQTQKLTYIAKGN